MWDADQRRLRRSFCRGPSDVGGFADDYAFLISGLLDLHAASGDEQWLRFALQLQDALDELFWDNSAGVSPRRHIHRVAICARPGIAECSDLVK